VDKDANASTLRTRLVYKSAEFKDVFLTLNMDDVRPIVSTDFNDTRNGKTQYPIVPDPKGTDLNLASLTFTGLENGTFVLGRQRIKRANLRFVGNVGWRQNEQTYDSVSFAYTAAKKLDFFYSYVDRVKRVFGPNENATASGPGAASWRSNSHLVDLGYTFNEAIKLFGYAYLLDFGNAATFSSQSIGLRATGGIPFGDGPKLSYVAEYANQQDYEDNPINYDANYYVLEGALGWERFGFKAGYEVLEGDESAGWAFQTPLATLHKFNGWADRFLVAPGGGLQDLYVEANAKFLQGTWKLIYHDFSADTSGTGANGGSSYGDEIDFVASWKIRENYSIMAKFALYSSDASACDVAGIGLWSCDADKVWVMATADF
jgi:hypothetical protein